MQNYEKVKLLYLYCKCRIKKASDFSEALCLLVKLTENSSNSLIENLKEFEMFNSVK